MSFETVNVGAGAPNTGGRVVRVGLTEAHGMAREIQLFAPPDVQYSFLKPLPGRRTIIRSPIKGYMRRYEAGDHDLIEAVLSPVRTRSRWVYSCENFQAATAFGARGLPLPRTLRVRYIRHLLLRDNCRQVIFWSHAGRRTLQTYAGLSDDDALLRKSKVVYPAVRRVPDELVQFNDGAVNLLFSGDFFRKGGVNVVDAFERVRRRYQDATLTVCCDERIDFNTPNTALRSQYLRKLRDLEGVVMLGRIDRDRLIREVLPRTDVYLLPTYVETFGMAVLEAMAFGIPVIATNHFAIPEMLEDEVSGLLIDSSQFDCERLFRGYVVKEIPAEFRECITEQLFARLCRLIESRGLRERVGRAALQRARNKFSFEHRNLTMGQIYRQALS